MKTGTFSINTPTNFSFWYTVYSHGWCSLQPFSVDKKHSALNRLLMLGNGSLVHCQITDKKGTSLHIKTTSVVALSPMQRSEIRRQLASCLRLTEDFGSFYREAKRYQKYRWIIRAKAGRLLRTPTVFEDVVKMICTTNCSWALTEIMINNLVEELGKPFTDSVKSFPSPETLAGTTEAFLRKNIRAGYRSPFLLEFAEIVAGRKLDVENWRSSELPTGALFKEIHSIKGVGNYAAGNILKLLGRYDYLGLDSWVRNQYYELHHRGRKVTDRTIERVYNRYGRWRGLFLWLEMTKHWYDHNFPF